MTERRDPMDAEDAQRVSETIDTTQGPGPVLDQDAPAAMPIFSENEHAQRSVPGGAVDAAEFAELGPRGGEELDHIAPAPQGDAPGVAGRAQDK